MQMRLAAAALLIDRIPAAFGKLPTRSAKCPCI
jgi:hypothetical protein